MKPISIIEAPLVSENYYSGVSAMAETLRKAGLSKRLKAKQTTQLSLPDWEPYRDSETHVLNPKEVRDYTIHLADAIDKDMSQDFFSVVVGGDCTILLGSTLALQRQGGRYGLFFVDGHADFYEPHISPSGETADMDLALAVGRGPMMVVAPEGKKPLVEESNTVLFGFRDEHLMKQAGNTDVRKTQINCFSLDDIRSLGFSNAIEKGIGILENRVEKFWIHVDLDVLDDVSMPAVDYRMPGGLSIGELVGTIHRLLRTGKACGINITIFNPTLDWDGSIARRIVDIFEHALTVKK